jgi:alpha-1,6-mannosyltransferase
MAFLAMVAWSLRGLQVLVLVSLFLLVVYYPDGEAALYNPPLLAVGVALAALAAVSLAKPDPLGLSSTTDRAPRADRVR